MAKFTTVTFIFCLIGTIYANPINVTQLEPQDVATVETPRIFGLNISWNQTDGLLHKLKNFVNTLVNTQPIQIQINSPATTETPTTATTPESKNMRFLPDIISQQNHRSRRAVNTMAQIVKPAKSDIIKMLNVHWETTEYYHNFVTIRGCTSVLDTIVNIGIELAQFIDIFWSCYEFSDENGIIEITLIESDECESLALAFQDFVNSAGAAIIDALTCF